MAAKSTQIEKLRRVEETADLLIKGHNFSDIREYAIQNNWPCTGQAQLYRYIKLATEITRRRIEKTGKQYFHRHVARLEYKYKLALEKKDLRLALAVEQEIAKTLSLVPIETKRFEHSGPGGTPIRNETTVDGFFTQVYLYEKAFEAGLNERPETINRQDFIDAGFTIEQLATQEGLVSAVDNEKPIYPSDSADDRQSDWPSGYLPEDGEEVGGQAELSSNDVPPV